MRWRKRNSVVWSRAWTADELQQVTGLPEKDQLDMMMGPQ
jgi:hypothetical protein